jgi:ATP-dependent DNA helicase RecG
MNKYSGESSQSISLLKGVGSKTQTLLSEIGIDSMFDLLSTVPIDFINKEETSTLNNIHTGDIVVVSGEIIKTVKTRGYKPNYIITISSNLGILTIRFIHKIIIFMNLQVGMRIRVSGSIANKKNKLEFIHPEIEIIKDGNNLEKIIPKYSIRSKVSQSKFRKLIRQAFSIFSYDYKFSCLDDYFYKEFNAMSLLKALKKLHFPQDDYDIALYNYNLAKQRLAFEEIYLHKHEFLKIVDKYNKKDSYLLNVSKEELENFYNSLPFELTKGQKNAVGSISDSFRSSAPSKVLVQGDVGCGKTIVAVIACLYAVKNNLQCLILVPTEVLCSQHFETFTHYLSGHCKVAMVSGKSPLAEKNTIKQELSSGKISVIVGTHSLLFNNFTFKNLAVVIIDEQHKFGVKQREKISSNYVKQPHLIYMSATPIPRTLALVLYENMNYLTIPDKPSNRVITETVVYSDNSRKEIEDNVSKHLAGGMQIYWVCTRIEDTEEDDKHSVNVFSENIRKRFNNSSVEVLHGKLSAEEKIKIINNFKLGKIDILVTTSVIEVGIDCSNANCLIVENSELFGLAQLHQLRGRVGRGVARGHCYLVHSDNTGIDAIDKLKYLESHHSGFDVAEFDLRIRGTGTYLGNKQSGMPDNYRVCNINDIMENISYIKKFKYELSSAEINTLKKRWKVKEIDEVQL